MTSAKVMAEDADNKKKSVRYANKHQSKISATPASYTKRTLVRSANKQQS